MFQIGDLVIYGGHGVCRIQSVQERIVDKKPVSYLVLSPTNQEKTEYFIPMHNQLAMSKLRHLHSAEEIAEMIRNPQIREDCWIPEENRRKLRYKELSGSSDFKALLQMVHCLEKYRLQQLEAGRKFHLADENFLRDAKKMLEAELSVVLDVPAAEVKDAVAALLHT